MTSEIRSVNVHLEKFAIVYRPIFVSCQELVGVNKVSAGSLFSSVVKFKRFTHVVFRDCSACGENVEKTTNFVAAEADNDTILMQNIANC